MFRFVVLMLLVVVAAVGFAIWVTVRRGRQIGELARRGVPATAIVTRRFRTGKGGVGSPGRRIGFAYDGPDGQRYERFATVTISRFNDVAEGDAYPIVLLPDAPGTSAPAWLVDAARGALDRRD